MKKKQFLQSLKDVYVRLAPTKHGVGVVAIRPISKGINPFKNCDLATGAIPITEKELNDVPVPEEVKELVRDMSAHQNGIFYAPNYGIDPIDKSYFVNHSQKPNMMTRDGGVTFVSARSIRKGEELTIDYRTFNDPKHLKIKNIV